MAPGFSNVKLREYTTIFFDSAYKVRQLSHSQTVLTELSTGQRDLGRNAGRCRLCRTQRHTMVTPF
jgi:hypothetical protein